MGDLPTAAVLLGASNQVISPLQPPPQMAPGRLAKRPILQESASCCDSWPVASPPCSAAWPASCSLRSHPTGPCPPSACHQIAKYCKPENVAFMKCKAADENPATCLSQGTGVTKCVNKVCVMAAGP